MGSATRGARVAAAAVGFACLLAVSAGPASADLASLSAACELRDAADGDPAGGGATLPFFFCDDGVPPSGGTDANETGAAAVEVPAAYQGFAGLPAKDPAIR